MIEVVAPRSLAPVIHPGQETKALGNFAYVGRVAASHGAEFTLTDQPQSEVGVERQVISSEESRELQLLMIVQLPHVIQRHQCSMCLILLSRIDRIRILHPASGGIDGIESVNRPQSRHVAVAEVANSEQRDRMVSCMEDPSAVDLELLTVLQTVQ